MKALLCALWKLSLLLVFITVCVFILVGDPPRFGDEKVLPGPPRCSVPEIVDRMEYHGTNVTWVDKQGTWWFRRGGEVLELRARP